MMSVNYCNKCHSSLMPSGQHLQVTQCVIEQHDKLTQQVAELRAALQSVKLHQEKITPSGFEFSGAWQVANKALEEKQCHHISLVNC